MVCFSVGKSRLGAIRRLAKCCKSTVQAFKKLGWIDLHTGLGPSGLGERIFACNDDAQALQRARAWWGGVQHADGTFETPITSFFDGSSTSAKFTGLMWGAAYEDFPARNTPPSPWNTALCRLCKSIWRCGLKIGCITIQNTQKPRLRWRKKSNRICWMRFTPIQTAWKGQIISQARQAMFQAVDGLNS